MPTEVDDFLAHYGVPGMKWGKSKGSSGPSRSEVRKALKAPNARYSQSARQFDKAVLGRGGVKAVNKRMNKGQTHKQASSAVFKRQILAGSVAAGLMLAAPHIANAGVSKAASSPKRVRGQKAIGTGYDTIKLKKNRDGTWG